MLAYLDHQASSPCRPAVLAAMAPWWGERCANASSRGHRAGLLAAAALERARGQVAVAVGAPSDWVVFTSGATEANNLALKGVAEAALARPGSRRRLVSLVSEHRAVLDPLRYLERHGFALTLLPVAADGRLELPRLEGALGPDVLLVSVMAANNEIGVLHPLAAVAGLCHRAGALLHVDAAQAAGHIPLAMAAQGIDLLSLSGHKCAGPQGVGALVIREGVELAPQLHGGGQEGGRRAGSTPVPLAVGLGEALQLAVDDQGERAQRLGALRDRLWEGLQALGGVSLNGPLPGPDRLAHNLNVTVAGVEGGALHQRLRRQLAVSSGSACSQGEPSHVLAALGRSRAEAAASIRFGLGPGTSAAEIELALTAVAEALRALRA
ncbi:MAG: cysteine desulfurase [Cyanobacteria bacterium M_surface_10_m2_119]|nr:cysteine desulfurase [Cyanobacteria bacterium M_surface_10_m2_119]